VYWGERAAQPVGVGRHQDEMNMAGHQAPRQHFDAAFAAMLRQKIAVERIIGVAEEGARAAIAALGDKVGNAGDDDTGEAGHVK
jgi:hypothetical protein